MDHHDPVESEQRQQQQLRAASLQIKSPRTPTTTTTAVRGGAAFRPAFRNEEYRGSGHRQMRSDHRDGCEVYCGHDTLGDCSTAASAAVATITTSPGALCLINTPATGIPLSPARLPHDAGSSCTPPCSAGSSSSSSSHAHHLTTPPPPAWESFIALSAQSPLLDADALLTSFYGTDAILSEEDDSDMFGRAHYQGSRDAFDD